MTIAHYAEAMIVGGVLGLAGWTLVLVAYVRETRRLRRKLALAILERWQRETVADSNRVELKRC